MKKIIIIFLIGFAFYTAKAQNILDSTTTQKIISLDELSDNQNKSKTDSLIIYVSQIEELAKSLNNGSKNWLPSVIALLVVLISTSGAVFIGKKQIKIQASIADEQLKSQESQAQDNLSQAREQIHETSKMTLAQVRANNISQARINWMQELRNEITNFNGNVALIKFKLQEVLDSNKEDRKEEEKEFYNKQINLVKNARQSAFKIKLFLNVEEDCHKKLEELIDKYFEIALDTKSDFNKIADDILKVSRIILKNVWEQAKHEGVKTQPPETKC